MFIKIGTSGWYYEHWDHVFYPEKLPAKEKLHFYADHFSTVEVNTTFYHLPKEATVKNWDAQVKKSFIFSVKASQYITHRKRLIDCEESLKLFYERIKYLDGQLGPILFQLPPSFKINLERIETFLKLLDPKKKHVFEFRNDTWYVEELYALLKKHGVALCITDLGGKLSPKEVTTNFTYYRLHGPTHKYAGSYGEKRLKEWKSKILEHIAKKIKVYCYFDNDEKGFAIQDALMLKEMLGDR